MTSLSKVRNAPVYTPPPPKQTEPNTIVAKQGGPSPESPAPTKPEAKQKVGHETTSTFEATAPTPGAPPKGGKEPKNKEEALLRADEVLNPRSGEKRDDDWTVLNDGTDGKATGKKEEGIASAQVKANEKLEKEELAKLSEGDRKKYKEVKDAIGEYHDKGSEQLALQKMLFQGKLPGEKDLKGEGTTLDHLADAASGKDLAKGINRGDFVGTLVREMATPSSINQGSKGTCAPTALSIDLADKNPAEYARISKGLASKEGKVELADGKTTLEREKEASIKDDGSGRSINQRIMAPTLMEFSNGDGDYNDKTGEGAGATTDNLDKLNDAIHGKNMRHESFGDNDKDKALSVIDSELKRGNNVLTGMRFEEEGKQHSYHEVLVTGTSEENGKKYIHFTNPWGTEERMLREDFADRVFSANYEGNDERRNGISLPPNIGGGGLGGLRDLMNVALPAHRGQPAASLDNLF
ncbi:hypothetical protein F0U62_35890 [Cystobacter fuscus]|uniref:hypothetical protein n=1 Tax=Cystobacter fuscus TaxID=43 RepID=UPI002B326117|nr:hypothetical protein F0U62_35890 [Cystobacter fuscus]